MTGPWQTKAVLVVACWFLVSKAIAGPDLCGNGRVDPGENCLTCPEDVICLECEECLGVECIFKGCPGDCGNGRIDKGEDCFTCPEDVLCDICNTCINSKCVTTPFCNCGDGHPDPGENCENCPDDVQCPIGTSCVSGVCEPLCGDGVPDPGEDCENCPSDVKCPPGKVCFEGECVVKCNPIVESMEVIFLFDTSGSMSDEAVALCSALDGIEKRLNLLGLDVSILVWGIAPGIQISCLTGYASQYGLLHNESWAPGSGQVAANYPWETIARIVVPISDEGPYQGNPCDYVDDAAAIEEAIVTCNEYSTIVSPIMGTVWQNNTEECIQHWGRILALGTGGKWYSTSDLDFEDLVLDLIQSSLCGCSGDLNGDMRVDILDFLLLLENWGLSDVDGDGDTDTIDVLLLLGQWGKCNE